MKKYLTYGLCLLFSGVTAIVYAQETPCPATITELKQIRKQNDNPFFSEKCENKMLKSIRTGNKEWILGSDFLLGTGSAYLNEATPIAVTLAIPANPIAVLELTYKDGGDSVATMQDLCVAPFIEPTEQQIKDFDAAAIKALQEAKVPAYLEKARQECIASFISDKKNAAKFAYNPSTDNSN